VDEEHTALDWTELGIFTNSNGESEKKTGGLFIVWAILASRTAEDKTRHVTFNSICCLFDAI